MEKEFNQNFRSQIRVFTWHIHGNYLWYLTQSNCQFYIPYDPARGEGYYGKTSSFTWGENVHQVPIDEVPQLELDCILFQSKKNYLVDQYDVLSEPQRQLPKIYLEHDPPREVPTDTKHVVNNHDVTLVHVTHFNDLMWDSGITPTVVIEHGVSVPEDAVYSGQIKKGIVVINNMGKRGRRLGLDIFEKVRKEVPLDLVGMGAEEVGGVGEVPPTKLAYFASQYRFFFNPIRYTSLGLAICEAMMVGLPVVGLATTELSTVITNGFNGYVDTNVEKLIAVMKQLLQEPTTALQLGQGAQQTAKDRFNIQRFTQEWETLFRQVASRRTSPLESISLHQDQEYQVTTH